MDTKFKIYRLDKFNQYLGLQDGILLIPIKESKTFKTLQEAEEALNEYLEEKSIERAELEYTILKILKY